MAPRSFRILSSAPPKRNPRRLARPRLESLDDRIAPALFTVQSPQSLGTTENFGCIATGDFNGDGKTDMVLTNYGTAAPGNNAGGNTLKVCLGNGNGTFGSANTITVGTDQYVSFVAVGDLNGDGKQDLAVVSNNEDTSGVLRIFLGNGNGGFTLSSQGAITVGSNNACGVVIGNVINGDPHPDVIVTSFGTTDSGQTTVFGNQIDVYQDDGTGQLTNIKTITNGISFLPTAITLGDFNGDGKMDIAATVPGVPPDTTSPQPNGTVQIINGNGAGDFTLGNSFDSGGALPVTISTADFNGDGQPDLVIANAGDPDYSNFYQNFGSNSAVGVAINGGGGSFNTTSLTAGIGTGGSKSVFAVAPADFNMDGKVDISAVLYGNPATSANARVLVYKGDGTGGFVADSGSPFAPTATCTGGQYLVAAQLDANASPDIVFATDSAKYEVLTNNTVTNPTVTVNQASGQADPTNGNTINFTAVFSQPVTGFDTPATDLDLSQSTGGGSGLTATITAIDSTHYTISVTGMSGVGTTGTVKVTIPAGAAQATSNGADCQASTSTDNSVSWDYVAPTVTINQGATQADPTATGPIKFDVVFSKPVSGFTGSDISFTGSSLSGLSASITTIDTSHYTVSVTGMSGNGTVMASIPAAAPGLHDAAGNANAASTSTDNTVTFGTAPSVTINQGSGQADPTNGNSIKFDVVFSADVTGFNNPASDVVLSGAGGLSAAITPIDGSHYTVTVTGMPAGSTGTVTATIPAGAATGVSSGSGNSASTSSDNTVSWDYVLPTVSVDLAAGQATPTSTSPIKFLATFSEPVNGFSASDVSFAGSTLSGLSASVAAVDSTHYTISVTGMSATGTVVASIPASAPGLTDQAGNPNAASTTTSGNSVTYDNSSILQFGQATFETNNGGDLVNGVRSGFATITVERTGNLNSAVSVNWATSARPLTGPMGYAAAVDGKNFVGGSGTLNWGVGDASPKTFQVVIDHFNQSMGNEYFDVVLSSPSGNATVGALGTAAVKIDKDHPLGNKQSFFDADGDIVTVKLTGPGTMTYFLDNGVGPISEIDLSGTSPTKSILSIAVKKPKNGHGDGRVQVGYLNSTLNSGIKAVNLSKADVMGNGIFIDAFVGSLNIGNVSGGAPITINATQGPPTQTSKTTITAGVIGDGTDILVMGTPLGKLKAVSVGHGTITAPSVGSISITGKKATPTTQGVNGDFGSALTVAGSLKSFKAAGAVTNANIAVNGNVGSFTAGTFTGSRLFLGGYAGPDDGSGHFSLPAATLGSFKVMNTAVESFVGSWVIAPTIGTAYLGNVDADSAVPIGLFAEHFTKTVTVMLPFKYVYPTDPGNPENNFLVQIISG